MIKIKRVYLAPERQDGIRILVDRLWPRGIPKNNLKMDEWFKDIAPSAELRKSFSHDPERWKEFKTSYLKELRRSPAKELVNDLLKLAKDSDITLLYGAKDEEHNNAIVLKQHLEKRSG